MLQEALKLNKLGLRVLPIGDNKRPLVPWREYQNGQTEQQVREIFSKQPKDIALLTGNGIEVIDIDVKYFLEHHRVEDVFDLLIEAIGEEDFRFLVITKTRSNGYHVIYKTDVQDGNQKLASRYTLEEEKKHPKDSHRVLIETRGEGGYILIPPSEGYDFDSKLFNLSTLPQLSTAQRNALISACMTFDEIDESFTQTKAPLPMEVQGAGKSTIDAYNEAHSCAELLEAYGWQRARGGNRGNIHYVRPGKSLRDGHSAGYHPEKNLVRIFSTSTCFPVEGSGSTYNPFQVYAHLEHGGDYKQAARKLYQMGYGDRISKTKESHRQTVSHLVSENKQVSEKVTNEELMKKIYSKRIDIRVKPKQKPKTLYMKTGVGITSSFVGIAGGGDLVNVFGGEKSGKSSLAACLSSCFLAGSKTGQTSLQFRADFEGKNFLHFDTEQNENDHYKMCTQMLVQQKLSITKHPTNLFSFSLLAYSKIERLSFIKYAIDNTPNIGAILLDGIVDICRNYNDLEESSDLVTFLMNMASQRKFVLVNVLHHARSTGQARGHLGTELLNKAACNFRITKEQGSPYSTCAVKNIRGLAPPDSFDFMHDANGTLVVV